MSDADTIRAASSRWLRENEARAVTALIGVIKGRAIYLRQRFGWSAWQANNMLTYLELVSE